MVNKVLDYCKDYYENVASYKDDLVILPSTGKNGFFVYPKQMYQLIKNDIGGKKVARWWCKIEKADGNIAGKILLLQYDGFMLSDLQHTAINAGILRATNNNGKERSFSFLKDSIKICTKVDLITSFDDSIKIEINKELDLYYFILKNFEYQLLCNDKAAYINFFNVDFLLIRALFSKYIVDKNYKDRIEVFLSLYKNQIIDFFNEKMFYSEETAQIEEIVLNKIELSDEIKTREYKVMFSEQFRKQEDYYKQIMQIEDSINIEALLPFNGYIYGEYYHKDKKIVLYPEAMKLSGKTGRDLEDLFLGVYIHELFHAFHANYCELHKQDWDYISKNNEILIESLAAAVEYYFVCNILKNQMIADEMLKTWDKHSIFVYPYTGAKAIINDCDPKALRALEKINGSGILQHEIDFEIGDIVYFCKNNLFGIIKCFYLSLGFCEFSEGFLLKDYIEKIWYPKFII